MLVKGQGLGTQVADGEAVHLPDVAGLLIPLKRQGVIDHTGWTGLCQLSVGPQLAIY